MKFKDLFYSKRNTPENSSEKSVFPSTEFDVFHGTYNFNAPYLESSLRALYKDGGMMCLIPCRLEMEQQGIPVHEDRDTYFDFRSENVISIPNNVNITEVDLVELKEILKDNLQREASNQLQFFIRGLGEERFEYYTIEDTNKEDIVGGDTNAKVVDIFDNNK